MWVCNIKRNTTPVFVLWFEVEWQNNNNTTNNAIDECVRSNTFVCCTVVCMRVHWKRPVYRYWVDGLVTVAKAAEFSLSLSFIHTARVDAFSILRVCTMDARCGWVWWICYGIHIVSVGMPQRNDANKRNDYIAGRRLFATSIPWLLPVWCGICECVLL